MNKYTRYSAYAIIIFSILVLSLASIYHVSGDGCWHVSSARFMAKNFAFPLFEPLGRDEPFWSPPLHHIIVAAVYYFFNIFSHNAANFSVKFISPVFGILSLIFSFKAVKKLFNPKIAFYSTLFLASVPIFIDYSVISYVESSLVFFAVLSVYFMLNGRIFLSSASAGLSILAKYNGAFIIPLLVYLAYKKNGKNKKLFYKKALAVIIVPLLISSPWLIRNWALLGNPIWPFLNFIFHGVQQKSFSNAGFAYLTPELPIYTYLGVFGVPDGNYRAFSFLKIPYSEALVMLWLAGTFVFTLPLILCFKGWKKNKRKGNAFTAVVLWIGLYIVLFFLYAINVGPFISRFMLPAFPAIAVFWALGFGYLKSKRLFLILFLISVIGLVSAEIIKTGIASSQWDFYRQDFGWVKASTKASDVFIANGQCIPYNIERDSLYATGESLKKADYIWLNQNFILDKRSILDEATLRSIESKNYKIAYANPKTKTVIYSAKQ